jgi:transcriptional regulator with XRE-family HTH domain
MTARDDLADALLRWRKAAGLTQDQAADKLRVDASQISRWENAKQLPRMKRSKDLARIYGVDLATVREKIGLADEENLDEANQALAMVAGLSERVDMMQQAMAEILRRLPER